MRSVSLKLTPVLTGLILLALAGGLLLACGCRSQPSPPAPDPRDISLPEGVEPIPFDTRFLDLQTADGRVLTLDLEIADTFTRRTRGLMHRTELGPDAGMLFIFPEETAGPFWNRDTPLDLDIAFLGPDGRLIELLHLEALSTELVAPRLPYLYALEMARGWFADRRVQVGDRLFVPPGLAALPE